MISRLRVRFLDYIIIISTDELATQLRHICCRAHRVIIFGVRYLRAYTGFTFTLYWELSLLDDVLERHFEQRVSMRLHTSESKWQIRNARALIVILFMHFDTRDIFPVHKVLTCWLPRVSLVTPTLYNTAASYQFTQKTWPIAYSNLNVWPITN